MSLAATSSRATWSYAALAAFALHLAAAAVMFVQTARSELEDFEGSSFPIELAAIALSPPDVIATKVAPPAPEIAPQDASNSETKAERPPEEEKSDVQLEQQSIADAEVFLPKPSPESKPEQTESTEAHEEVQDQAAPTQAVIAQEASAPPAVETSAAAEAKSLSEGITPSARRSRSSWERGIMVQLDRHKRYPQEARDHAATGEATVGFTLLRSGAVIGSRLVASSGSALLDAEALRMVERASPLPPPPIDVAGDRFEFVVPVRFKVR